MNTPTHYLPIMPYLIVSDATTFLDFVHKVFGAKEELIVLRKDETIMHAEISIGKATFMLAEATDEYKPFPCSMFLLCENIDDVYKRGIDNGAKSLQEMDNREYGRSAGFQDTWAMFGG